MTDFFEKERPLSDDEIKEAAFFVRSMEKSYEEFMRRNSHLNVHPAVLMMTKKKLVV